MENEKKVYETPVVTKVEYDVRDQITATGCNSEYTDVCSPLYS
jgi:hypothetical protein